MTWETRWTKVRKDRLRELSKTMNASELAQEFGCSTSAISRIQARIGLGREDRVVRHKFWTKQDLLKLQDLLERYSISTVARKMQRSFGSVRAKATELGWKPRCAVYSISSAAVKTGYRREQLLVAKKALDQNWRQDGKHAVSISDEQLEAMCVWLRDNEVKISGEVRELTLKKVMEEKRSA